MTFYISYRADQIHILGQSSNPFESYALVEMMAKELKDNKGYIFYHKKCDSRDTSKRAFFGIMLQNYTLPKKFLTAATFLHIN